MKLVTTYQSVNTLIRAFLALDRCLSGDDAAASYFCPDSDAALRAATDSAWGALMADLSDIVDSWAAESDPAGFSFESEALDLIPPSLGGAFLRAAEDYLAMRALAAIHAGDVARSARYTLLASDALARARAVASGRPRPSAAPRWPY